MLIVVSGLPGVGKTTVAAGIARRRGAMHLSVDVLEDALLAAGLQPGWTTGVAAYQATAAAAEQNLRLGHQVVVDAVNDSRAAREVWRSAARAAVADVRFYLLNPPNRHEHRRRLLARERGLTHVPEPTWDEVERRAERYEPWQNDVTTLDSSVDVESLVEAVLRSGSG